MKQVLQRLEQHGIQTRKSKCAFLCTAVEYLGLKGVTLHTLESKVKAVVEAPHPRDVQELHLFFRTSPLLWQILAKPLNLATSP